MFLKGDIYTSSGSLKLYNCWTDRVTKFDSSSFYNWEQDNMPVYDLDERTFYLWEQLGYPTSSLPGAALVVSADATNTDIGCNKNIYRSVSAAVAALPQTINFPVLIEVANFGALGDLVLDNIKFGPRGSIEIINRNFARSDADISALGAGYTRINYALAEGASNPYYYASSMSVDSTIAALYPNKFGAKNHFFESSCLSISAPVFSSTSDSRLINSLNGFIQLKHSNGLYNKSTLIIDTQNTVSPYSVTSLDVLPFKAYDLNSDSTESISTYDVSTIDYLNNDAHLFLYSYDVTSYTSNGLFYGNKLNKLIINNCNGPIFIRNFFLNGNGANSTSNNYGVEVNNSKNVYLENLISTRYRKAGFIFNNSNVTILRGCVATRNYDFDSSNNRLTGPWAMVRNYNAFEKFDDAAGMIANNSVITVSSTKNVEDTLIKSKILADTGITNTSSYTNSNYIFEFSKNANGIILNNSILTGGDKQNLNSTLHYLYAMQVNCYNNNNYGINSLNSKISLNARLALLENLYGMKLDSSVFEIDKVSFVYNQRIGLVSNNSNIIYNKNLASYVNGGSNQELETPLYFSHNGQHIVTNNSKMSPVMTSSMDLIYDCAKFINGIGKKNPSLTADKELIPSIELINNSDVVLISPQMSRDFTHAKDSDYKGCKGSELAVLNGSKATLQGARYKATKVVGPAGRDYQKNIAGLYAGKNSNIELNGPTVIAQYGIDLFAENKSSININPHLSKADGSLDISSFTLIDKRNHTAVELHSTRSCIVIDDNSTLNVRDLGSFEQSWSAGNFYSNRVLSGIDYTSIDYIAPYVSAGSLQFYPNPIIPDSLGTYGSTFPGVDTLGALLNGTAFSENSLPGLYYLKDHTTTQNFDFSTVTNGGFCVRALNNSLVNIHNVNFPAGWWNCSAPYYDNTVPAGTGGLCYKTFIWNIADNSQLKASYLSVSSLFPAAAGYIGPNGVWTSGANLTASGLPNSTPDTSSVSILDYFGAAPVSANILGQTSATNYGPFRLYFSVNPATKALNYSVASDDDNEIIYQIYSQGYQPSGLMKVDPVVSSMYSMFKQRTSYNSFTASGFYYGSAMMPYNDSSRILLDESAANVFANAKHCATGKSGNAKLVSIYYPYNVAKFGDSYNSLGIRSVNNFDLQRDN